MTRRRFNLVCLSPRGDELITDLKNASCQVGASAGRDATEAAMTQLAGREAALAEYLSELEEIAGKARCIQKRY